jgi:integrase
MGLYKRKRKDGSYLYEFRKTIRGVKYYEAIPEAKTKLQAQVAEADILRRIYEGRYGREGGEIGAYDFVKFVEDIYLPHAKGHLRLPEQAAYKCQPLINFFRGKRLRDITLIEVEKFRRSRLLDYKPVTVKSNITVLSTVLNFAVDNDYLASNPCRRIKWRRGEVVSARGRVASAEEIEALMPELEEDRETRAAVILALNAGLRRMGILSLTKSDPDFGARTLRYTAKGGKRKIVPVNAAALEVLRELVGRSTYPDGRLFGDVYGYSLSFEKGAFKQACKRAGIKGLNFHDLRKSFATNLVRAGVHPLVIKELLGHAQMQTTETHYAFGQWQQAVEAVELLAEKKGNVVDFRKRQDAEVV